MTIHRWIKNECGFNTKFIELIEQKNIMRASWDHNVILFNK